MVISPASENNYKFKLETIANQELSGNDICDIIKEIIRRFDTIRIRKTPTVLIVIITGTLVYFEIWQNLFAYWIKMSLTAHRRKGCK